VPNAIHRAVNRYATGVGGNATHAPVPRSHTEATANSGSSRHHRPTPAGRTHRRVTQFQPLTGNPWKPNPAGPERKPLTRSDVPLALVLRRMDLESHRRPTIELNLVAAGPRG